MSGKFSMDGYVDVAERIAMFIDKYPEGSLQSELEPVEQDGKLVGWLCRAEAYRTPDDPRPGIGHAVEPVPGRTPYTKDSEAMNAETSAWGRAIIALGFETKKIASANEVRNRQAPTPPPVDPATDEQRVRFQELCGQLTEIDPSKNWPQLMDAKAVRDFGTGVTAISQENMETLLSQMAEHVKGSVGEQPRSGADGPSVPEANGVGTDAPAGEFTPPTAPRGSRRKATA